MTATRVQTLQSTWLGVPAIQKNITGGTLPRGQRIIAMHWLADAVGQPTEYPAGTCTRRVVAGDFTKGTGRIVEPEQIITLAEFNALTRP